MALCSGIGGLDLGLAMALGGGYRSVVHVEREAFAAAVLLARMEEADLERAPIWDDLTTFDARAWRGVVDIVTAGFPCQPWSSAGKRRGVEDERWLWPDIARIIDDCGAPLVFLENVPGLYRHGLREVLSDLAALGFDAEWLCASACEVGAPHTRERVFLLAYTNGVNGIPRLGIGRRTEANNGVRALFTDWGPDPERAEGYFAARLGARASGDRVAHGHSARVDRLRALGNGVVPAQAAAAFRELAVRVNA